MSVEIHKLSNGATVIIDPMPHVETASLGYYFRVGSRYETKKENGLAHFLEHMAFKGTPTRNVQQLALAMDDIGANSNAFTGKEGTCYFLNGDAEDIFTFNTLVSDMAINMSLPAEELERERGAILEEIKMYNDKPTSIMFERAEAVSYLNQALGRSILGPSKNIETFDRSAFEKFRKKYYHAGNLIVSVAGNVDPARILEDINQTAGQMLGGKRSKFKKADYVGGASEVIRPDNQINLLLAFQASAYGEPDMHAMAVMNKVLKGGMSSRLFVEIREKRGLVYTIQAGGDHRTDMGESYIYAGTSPDKVSKLVPVLCDELNKIRQDFISDEELVRAKKQLIVSTLAESGPQSRMVSNASKYNMSERISTKEEFREAVNAVTKQDVQAIAQKVFSGVPTLSSVGPSNFPKFDDIVQRLDI